MLLGISVISPASVCVSQHSIDNIYLNPRKNNPHKNVVQLIEVNDEHNI